MSGFSFRSHPGSESASIGPGGTKRPPSSDRATPADIAESWFALLDQRVLWFGDEQCLMHVTGVHVTARGVWIQLQCGEETVRSFVVHVGNERARPSLNAIGRIVTSS